MRLYVTLAPEPPPPHHARMDIVDGTTTGGRAALTDRARALADTGGRRVLGIAGPPGAGKSTLADRLVAALDGRAALVPMDGFHLAAAELERLGRADRKGAPDTFDAAGYTALLRRLRAPDPVHAVYAPAFDRSLEEPVAGSLPVAPDVPLVVTEGNYLLLDDGPWAPVRGLLDEVWFLDPDARVRVQPARRPPCPPRQAPAPRGGVGGPLRRGERAAGGAGPGPGRPDRAAVTRGPVR